MIEFSDTPSEKLTEDSLGFGFEEVKDETVRGPNLQGKDKETVEVDIH